MRRRSRPASPGREPDNGLSARGNRQSSRRARARGAGRPPRSFMRVYVVGGELLERCAGQAERFGFLQGAIGLPAVDLYALDEPHRRGAVRARAVDVGGLVAWLLD